MTRVSSLRAKRYALLRLLSLIWRPTRLPDMNRFTALRIMAGNPVAVLPVRRDPGAGRWGVVGRSRVIRRRRIVGRGRCHHDRRGVDAIAIVAVPPGVRRLGRGGNADGGEAKDGAGGG